MTDLATRRSRMGLAVLALLAASLLRQFAQPAPSHYFEHDQQVYLAMARAPFADTPQARSAPASWRILPALLARGVGDATGRGPELGFFILTFASFALIPIATTSFLRQLGVTSTSAIACGGVAAMAPPIVGYMSWDVVRVDAFGLLLVVAAAIATVTQRPMPLVIAVGALSLTKETVLLAAFFAVAWSVLYARRMLPIAVASLAIGVAIRWVILPWWLSSPVADRFTNLNGFLGMVDALSIRYVGRRVLLATSGTWNVLLPLAAIWLARDRLSARTLLFTATIAVAMSQMLFASDTQRIVAAGYPFVLALCAFELDRLPQHRRRLVGLALVVGQLPWLLTYGRIADMPGIRAVEILIFIAAALAAVVTWARSPAAVESAVTGT